MPIIQTRGMKVRKECEKFNKQKELEMVNEIDKLTSLEISGGNITDDEVMHDGVDLSIHGSDLEDFPDAVDVEIGRNNVVNQTETESGNDDSTEADDAATETEPGELSSSEEDDISTLRVASKVVKVQQRKVRDDGQKRNKYSHLKDDPEFKSFLEEMLDCRMAARQVATPDEKHERHKKSSKHCENCATHLQNKGVATFKSPSDMTIYSPGLRKASSQNDDTLIIEKISDFVENIRLNSNRK